MEENGVCSICGGEYTYYGNNAEPVNNGRCCNECNDNVVIPARIAQMVKRKMSDKMETLQVDINIDVDIEGDER